MSRDSHADYERYKAYYLAREESPQGKHKRAERQRVRRQDVREGKLHGPHDPREVDHIKALARGGSGAASNTRIISEKANREKFDH